MSGWKIERWTARTGYSARSLTQAAGSGTSGRRSGARYGGRHMITATIFNHAGGAGKTSITRDVGYQFAQAGLRVLLVDLDPQANLSS